MSDDHFSSIKTYGTTLLDGDCDAAMIIAQLKKEYPVLDKIVIAYRPCGTYVMLYPHKPLCCINEDHVFAANNEIFAKNYFSLNALSAVAHVIVAQECLSRVSTLVSSLLSVLPPDFKDMYDLEVCNEHHVRLHDKKEKNFTIISSATQKEMPFLLTQCAAVKKKMNERKDFDERKKWVADIRFADYIIAYRT